MVFDSQCHAQGHSGLTAYYRKVDEVSQTQIKNQNRSHVWNRYYRAYSSIAIPFVPYLLDQEDFERRLVSVVQILSETLDDSILSQAAADMSYRDLSGYALIFAVLASGCQFADEITSERILTTRVFGE